MAVDERYRLIFEAQDSASAVIQSIAGNLGKMTAAFAAVGAVGLLLKSAVAEAKDSEEVFHSLGQTLKGLGEDWTRLEGPIRSWATGVMNATGESDEAIARSMQTLMQYGATATQAMQRTEIAIDAARARHISLEEATNGIARAQIGFVRGLATLGLNMREAEKAGLDLDGALQVLHRTTSGAAAADLETYSGQVHALKVQFGELKEGIGRELVPALSALTGSLYDLITIGNSDLNVFTKFDLLMGQDATAMRAVAAEIRNASAGLAEANKLFLSADNSGFIGPPTPGTEDMAEIVRYNKWLTDEKKRLAEATEKANAQEALFWRTLHYESAEVRNTILGEYEKSTARTTKNLADSEAIVRRLAGEDIDRKYKYDMTGAATDIYERWNRGEIPGMQPPEPSDEKSFYERSFPEDKQYVAKIKKEQEELQRFLTGTTEDTMNAIVDQFMRGRIRLADIFKGMAQDFLHYFIHKLAEMVGLKLLTAIVGGPGNLVTTPGDWTGSAEQYSAISVGGGGGLGKVSSAGVVVVTVPMEVSQDYIRRKVIPEIQRLKRAGVAV